MEAQPRHRPASQGRRRSSGPDARQARAAHSARRRDASPGHPGRARRESLRRPYARKVYRKAQARLRQEHGIRTSMRRVLRLMREHGLLVQQRSTTVPALGLVLVDHRTGEFLGVRVALRGTRYETEAPKATECLREAIWATKGRHDVGVAHGVALRHDHGSQFVSHAFQDELRTVGIASSPSFVRQPEGHGCVERFIRTLKEQPPLLRRFSTVTELGAAPREFQRRFNHHWIIGQLGHRAPARHRRILLGEAA